MSFSGLFAIGLSGVNAHAVSLESVSNNIANSQTTGFKRTRTDFSSLITLDQPGGGIQGGGVDVATRQILNEQGAITRTNSATDLAISGNGFFVVTDPTALTTGEETALFTRSGGFSIQPDGTLANEAGFLLQGIATIDGAAPTNASLGSLEAVNVNRLGSISEQTTQFALSGSLSTDATTGTVIAQRGQLVTGDGTIEDVIFSFTKTDAVTWTGTIAQASAPTTIIGSGTLSFNADGTLAASSTFPAAVTIGGQQVNVDIAGLSAGDGAARISSIRSDGAPLGDFTNLEIGRDGVVTANFSNGLSRSIYQLVLASFINPEGLEEGAASTYAYTNDAGTLDLFSPLSNGAGAIESSALEISTVDIAQEFSRLIETQRAYSANTRVITIADELWRTLTQTAT